MEFSQLAPNSLKDIIHYLEAKGRFAGLRLDSFCRLLNMDKGGYRFGRSVSLYKVVCHGGLEAGDHTLISGPTQILCYPGSPLVIGKFCSVAPNCCFVSFDHPVNYAATEYPLIRLKASPENRKDYDRICRRGRIEVGNDVWIGTGATVLRGCRIGDGAIVGAGAVVTKDVRPYTIVAGVPAKQIGKRFGDETVEQLLEIRWWDWPDEKIIRNRRFFSTDLADFRGKLSGLIVD
ncbi:MAG: CatB-related O-acetyltransferase [Candidatus Micrarchaeia archaeon]